MAAAALAFTLPWERAELRANERAAGRQTNRAFDSGQVYNYNVASLPTMTQHTGMNHHDPVSAEIDMEMMQDRVDDAPQPLTRAQIEAVQRNDDTPVEQPERAGDKFYGANRTDTGDTAESVFRAPDLPQSSTVGKTDADVGDDKLTGQNLKELPQKVKDEGRVTDADADDDDKGTLRTALQVGGGLIKKVRTLAYIQRQLNDAYEAYRQGKIGYEVLNEVMTNSVPHVGTQGTKAMEMWQRGHRVAAVKQMRDAAYMALEEGEVGFLRWEQSSLMLPDRIQYARDLSEQLGRTVSVDEIGVKHIGDYMNPLEFLYSGPPKGYNYFVTPYKHGAAMRAILKRTPGLMGRIAQFIPEQPMWLGSTAGFSDPYYSNIFGRAGDAMRQFDYWRGADIGDNFFNRQAGLARVNQTLNPVRYTPDFIYNQYIQPYTPAAIRDSVIARMPTRTARTFFGTMFNPNYIQRFGSEEQRALLGERTVRKQAQLLADRAEGAAEMAARMDNATRFRKHEAVTRDNLREGWTTAEAALNRDVNVSRRADTSTYERMGLLTGDEAAPLLQTNADMPDIEELVDFARQQTHGEDMLETIAKIDTAVPPLAGEPRSGIAPPLFEPLPSAPPVPPVPPTSAAPIDDGAGLMNFLGQPARERVSFAPVDSADRNFEYAHLPTDPTDLREAPIVQIADDVAVPTSEPTIGAQARTYVEEAVEGATERAKDSVRTRAYEYGTNAVGSATRVVGDVAAGFIGNKVADEIDPDGSGTSHNAIAASFAAPVSMVAHGAVAVLTKGRVGGPALSAMAKGGGGTFLNVFTGQEFTERAEAGLKGMGVPDDAAIVGGAAIGGATSAAVTETAVVAGTSVATAVTTGTAITGSALATTAAAAALPAAVVGATIGGAAAYVQQEQKKLANMTPAEREERSREYARTTNVSWAMMGI